MASEAAARRALVAGRLDVALSVGAASEAARAVAAVAAALLMYVSLALYGGAVATGVAQEKTSRTAEVLLAVVRPSQLLTGKVLSLLPPFTAALMPARIALGHIAAWELPAARLIMLASIYAMIRLASRVYANAFMHGGARLSWGAAWRLRPRAWQAPP